ncbi:forkhead box protein k1 [Biomphalaria glabrata]
MANKVECGNLQAMVLTVKSVLDHVNSSDTDPKHQHSDPHWCGYLKDPSSYKHKNSLPRSVVEFIRPIFNDLADEKLLSRCLHGKTQNANESLNKLIWDRCSKEYFAEKTTIEKSVYSAISHFNDGASSILKLHENLGIAGGYYSEKLCKKKRMTCIKKLSSQSTKKNV